VVEVEFDLVGRGTNRLITSELELLEEVLVGVLSHLAALISIKEDIVNIEGSSNKRLLVSSSDRFDTRGGGEVIDGPETLANRTEIKVDLNFVILYESLIPSLSGYLLAFSYAINHIKNIQEHKPGARLYLKPS